MSQQPLSDDLRLDEESLTCEVVPERDIVRVRPIGSLDMATVPVVETQLQQLLDAGFRQLVVDLGGLAFMDSTGLRLAIRWSEAARRDGFTIGFVPGSPEIQRVFEITGMSEHVPFIRHS
jgi:anti-sigma B factor antagonist